MIASAIAIFQAARKAPGTALCVLGAIAALCALSFVWGLGIGQKAGDNKVSAQQLRQAQDNLATAVQANKDLKTQMAEGEQAAMALRDELDLRDTRINDLNRRLKYVPTFVATSSCPAPGAVYLSVGAVQLYDAALTDGAGGQLPGGACGVAAGASSAANVGEAGQCSQSSGITVGEFQEVAQINAERHGECSLRLRSLIQFLKDRETQERARSCTNEEVK